MKPGEDFEDSGEIYDSRMEEERRHLNFFPEFRSWSKPAYPRRQTHNNPTDKTHPTKTYDPPPRFEKAKTGENCRKPFFNCACVFNQA